MTYCTDYFTGLSLSARMLTDENLKEMHANFLGNLHWAFIMAEPVEAMELSEEESQTIKHAAAAELEAALAVAMVEGKTITDIGDGLNFKESTIDGLTGLWRELAAAMPKAVAELELNARDRAAAAINSVATTLLTDPYFGYDAGATVDDVLQDHAEALLDPSNPTHDGWATSLRMFGVAPRHWEPAARILLTSS